MSRPVRWWNFVALAALAAAGPLAAQAPLKQVIGASTATLSPAIRVGNLLFVSGQLGRDSTVQGQTTAALENLKRIVEQAGSSMDNVVKCTVFLIDVKDFAAMNQSYSAAFPKDPPARSTVVVAALVSAAAKVEIECVAALPR